MLQNTYTLEADNSFLPFPMTIGGYEDTNVDGFTVLDWMHEMLDPTQTWTPRYGFE